MKIDLSNIPPEVLEILDSAYITISNTPEFIKTFDAEIYLFDIVNPEYRGVVVKRMKPTDNFELKRKRNELLKKEFEAFKKFQEAGFYQGSERIPKIINYNQKNSILLEERIYGNDIRTEIQKNPKSAYYLGSRVADWLLKLHKYNQKNKKTNLNQTKTYEEFTKKLDSDKNIYLDNSSKELYENIIESVKILGEHNFDSIEANLHGDPSPIHFFHSEKGVIQSIDFNASSYDSIYKDCGTLISNSYIWLVNTKADYDKFINFIDGFKNRYESKLGRELDRKALNFYTAKSEYDKARTEKIIGNSEVAINYLDRINRLLSSDDFALEVFF